MPDIKEYNRRDNEDQLPNDAVRDNQTFCWSDDRAAFDHLRDKMRAGLGAFPVTRAESGGFYGQIFSEDARLGDLNHWIAERNAR